MNIFYLDTDPRTAAAMHCDKHVVKMILESAQILSTAHQILDGPKKGLYKPTHKNHPSAVWARQAEPNYIWLYSLLYYLCAEYTARYGKSHKTKRSGIVHLLSFIPDNIPKANFSSPPQCMPDTYKVESDTVQAYRNYYMGAKSGFAKWKLGNVPFWWNINQNKVELCPFTIIDATTVETLQPS
jgi:hypothetical protein